MPEIKTRDAVKGTIKTLDKAAIAGDRMKQVYVRTKDKAENSISASERNPEEYASDRISGNADSMIHEAVYQFDRHGRKAVKTTKDNISTVRERMAQRRAEQPKRAAQKQAEKRTKQQAAEAVRSVQTHPFSSGASPLPSDTEIWPQVKTRGWNTVTIKSAQQSGVSVRQTTKSTGNVVANVRKGTIKTASRSIKSAERTASTAAKAMQATSAAQKSALAAAKTSKRTAQVAQTAAKKTAEATKAAAKGTVSAVKGIIAGTKALISALLAGGWISVIIILIVVLLGCAVSLFGGGSSNSYTPVSAEAEAYEPLIRQYASQYGIPEYVELIKAVMMQESGGRGLDPMQAAEGSFNTRYPHEPNGIQDPEYSIQCGVQELKAALISAKVENPVDMERIKLALQGYNFGNGYISWAVSNYGGYSYANAVEFSARQAERLGWSSYGDTQYPNHVLRYYPYGRAFTAGGNQVIVEVALTQLGNEGGAPYWSWYGFDSRVEWCACFVSWCADQCGYIESGVIPKFSACVDGVSWFRSNGQWQDRNYEPQAGDIIFFDWDGDGTSDHVGIVEKCENGVVYTVEGNSGDACRGRQYSVGSGSILGYGVPAY